MLQKSNARIRRENVSGSAVKSLLVKRLNLRHQLGARRVHQQTGDVRESTFHSALYRCLVEPSVAFLIEICNATPSFPKSDE